MSLEKIKGFLEEDLKQASSHDSFVLNNAHFYSGYCTALEVVLNLIATERELQDTIAKEKPDEEIIEIVATKENNRSKEDDTVKLRVTPKCHSCVHCDGYICDNDKVSEITTKRVICSYPDRPGVYDIPRYFGCYRYMELLEEIEVE